MDMPPDWMISVLEAASEENRVFCAMPPLATIKVPALAANWVATALPPLKTVMVPPVRIISPEAAPPEEISTNTPELTVKLD